MVFYRAYVHENDGQGGDVIGFQFWEGKMSGDMSRGKVLHPTMYIAYYSIFSLSFCLCVFVLLKGVVV